MKKIILLATSFLFMADMYAQTRDSLEVTHTVSIENPDRVTLRQSDKQLTVEIEGENGNPDFHYVREVNLSGSESSVTKERNGNWDFNIPFRKQTAQGKRKRNAVILKDLKLGLSTSLNTPAGMDVNMASSWEITTPTLGWAYYPWRTNTYFSIGIAGSWRNYRMTGKQRFIKEGSNLVLGSYPEGADIQFSRIKIFSWSVPMMMLPNEQPEERKEQMEKLLFTSESVTEGHPDKMCDAISDAILDACMEQDPMSRVACETASCTGFVLVTGEITTKAQLDIPSIVRKTVNEIGYNDAKTGFDGHTCAVMVALDQQSPDIAMGVDKALEAKENKMSDEQLEAIGAGDQGMMFGYATNETPELMPYPISLAHKLALQLTKVRKDGTLKYLRPDGKTQVSVEYDENGKPKRLEAVVLSTQHDEDVTQEQIHEDIKKYVFDPILPIELVDAETKFFINPTGRFVIGGPHGDAGLTGRKIIVDTYGGYARHGGGAFSGKDCTKVDRSAAYAARYVAKNIVAAGLADKCEIQLSYAIGVAQPTSIMVDTFGTGKLSDEKLVELVRENFDLRPAGIIKMLDLRRPIYRGTAAYGHFGRTDLNLPWEATDKAETLKKYL